MINIEVLTVFINNESLDHLYLRPKIKYFLIHVYYTHKYEYSPINGNRHLQDDKGSHYYFKHT